jgi:hypothetical protein
MDMDMDIDIDIDIDVDVDVDVETPASFSLYDKPQRKKYVEACKNIVYRISLSSKF